MNDIATTVENTPLLAKRNWHYLRQPAHFEIAPHICGHNDAQWSEYDKHLWCSHCEVDFIPKHSGILDGPIPIEAAMSMGMCFDRVLIADGKLDPFIQEELRWQSEEKNATT